MTSSLPSPIFAGIDDLLPILVVIFGVLSWLFNMIKERNQEQARQDRPVRRNPRPQQEDSLQSEIDIFIQEVTQQRGDQQSGESARQQNPERGRRSQTRQPQQTPTTVSPQAPPAKHKRLSEELADRKGLGSQTLGQGVGRHVQQHIESHSVSEESDRRLSHNVDASVSAHLGTASSQAAEVTHDEVNPMVEQVRDMLSNPATVGQAILLHEILTPRHRRGV